MTSTRSHRPKFGRVGRWVARIGGMDPTSWPGRAVTWGPVVLLMATIFWLSSQSQPLGMGDRWFDEALGIGGHFVEYGLLALAWRWALARQWPDLRRPGFVALGLTLLYAFSDEFHQGFVPGRNPDPLDILIDATGAVTALWLSRDVDFSPRG